jgi:hypothetical protein
MVTEKNGGWLKRCLDLRSRQVNSGSFDFAALAQDDEFWVGTVKQKQERITGFTKKQRTQRSFAGACGAVAKRILLA